MTDRERIQAFAEANDITFTARGECGFGRPCVGLLRAGHYVSWRPFDRDTFETLSGFGQPEVAPPKEVVDAYHKDDCCAVLVHDGNYDEAIRQLALWVDALVAANAGVKEYKTGAQGLQAVFSGVTGLAFYAPKASS